MNKDAILSKVHELSPWYHNIELPFGIQTDPTQKTPARAENWGTLIGAIPTDMTGMTVLDIGTNAGAFAIEAARRGAARVVGFDQNERYIAQAKFCAEAHGLAIEYRCASLEDFLPSCGAFDFVFFIGVLYHTQDPIRVSRLVRSVTKRLCLVETVNTSTKYRNESFGIVQFPRPTITHSGSTWVNKEGLRYIYQDVCGFKRLQFLFSDNRVAFLASVDP